MNIVIATPYMIYPTVPHGGGQDLMALIRFLGERHAVRPGDAILIKPLCRHRAIGRLRVLNVPVPAFDPEDEWFD